MSLHVIRSPAMWLLLGLMCLDSTHGQEEEPAATEEIGLGDDELLPFQDLPVVVSASRQAEKQGHTAVPVSVFTAEDIHYSGAMVLPEVFPFIPGVDVLQIDRNRHGIGIRGLHDFLSDRTLTLINGRSAENPTFGGGEYLRYPLLLEDIERIEVVRGPGGAAWGANALNGVINIITKKPEDTQGVLAGTAVDEFGDTSSHVRWGARKGDWAWRTSFGYTWFESSEKAISGDDFASSDFHRDALFDGEARVNLSPDTRVTFGVGYQYKDLGDFETTGVYYDRDGHEDTIRAFVKAEHDFGNGMDGYLQWFGNFANKDIVSLFHAFTMQNDLEGQLSFSPARDHRTTVGTNVRWTRIEPEMERPTDFMLKGGDVDEYQVGAFVLDQWEVNQWLTFEGQIRGDWYSGTHLDGAARLAVLYTPDAAGNHGLRFSAARAFRAPFAGLRLPMAERFFTPFGFSALNVVPNEELDNEGIWSLEMGYTGRLIRNLTFRLDGYYQRYERLIGFENEFRSVNVVAPPIPFPIPVPVTDIVAHNINGAKAFGAEAELTYRWKWGLLSAWYAHNHFESDISKQRMRAFYPAQDKAGLTARLFLPHQVTLNALYRADFGRIVNAQRPDDAHGYNRIDFTVSKGLDRERYELQIGVRDLLDQTGEATMGVGGTTKHNVPGRTFFARFQMKF